MKFIIYFLICIQNLISSEINFQGNVTYYQQKNKALTNTNNIEYKFNLYKGKYYIINLSNSLSVDFDCFQNEIKETNVFTTIEIEF